MADIPDPSEIAGLIAQAPSGGDEILDVLARRFESTGGGAGFGWVASQVFGLKLRLEGRIDSWDADAVTEILLGGYPASVVLEPASYATVVDGTAALMRFLGETRVIDKGLATAIADHVVRIGPRFHSMMADPENWSSGKRLWAGAQAEGIDMDDADAMGRWMEDFNSLSFEERGAILGPAKQIPSRFTGVMPKLPPVVLAPTHELERAANESVWFKRVCGFVDFIGDGRALTTTLNLKLADGRALVELLGTGEEFDPAIGDRVFKTRSSGDLGCLDMVFRLAVTSRMAKIVGKRVVPGPKARRVNEPLECVYGLWLALLGIVGPTKHRYRTDAYGFGWFAEELDSQLRPLLVDLYCFGAAEIDEVADDMWAHLGRVYDLSTVKESTLSLHAGSVTNQLRHALSLFEELAIVTVENTETVPSEYGRPKTVGGTVSLAPFGVWAMQRLLSSEVEAPVVGALRQAPAVDLLSAAADMSEQESAAEIGVWIADHGAAGADELVDALGQVGTTGRELAFHALLGMGALARNAVERLSTVDDLAPFVTIFRVESLDASFDEMDCRGDPDRFVRLLSMVVELFGPIAASTAWAGPAAGEAGLASMLDKVWRVDDPDTALVLGAIGSEHPDKVVARVARKALFKHRSRG